MEGVQNKRKRGCGIIKIKESWTQKANLARPLTEIKRLFLWQYLLTYSFGDVLYLCIGRKNKLWSIGVAVPLLAILLCCITFLWVRRRKKGLYYFAYAVIRNLLLLFES